MNQRSWPTVAAFALAAVLLLARLGGLPFTDPDEGRNATVAREMLARGEWLVPSYDGVTYLDKPALFFRMVATSMGLVGKNEAGARLPSALCALGVLAMIYAFCRREYDQRTAALAVAVTASAPLFFGFGRTVIFDMPLTLAVTASILASYRAEHPGPGHAPGSGTGPGPRLVPGRLPWWSGGSWHAIAAVATGVAVLIKGPVGLIVPALVTWVAWLIQGRAGRRPGFARRVFAPVNVLLVLAVVLPWFLGVVHRQPDFAHYGLVEETVRRYATTSFHRTAPWWYYGPVLLGTFFPWSALVPGGVGVAWQRRRTLRPADRLFVAWAIVVVAFFSTSQSKLPGYVLSAVVALGVLAARLFAAAMTGDLPARRLVLRSTLVLAVLAILAASFLGFVAADPAAARRIFRIKSGEFERLRPAFTPLAVTLAVVALAAIGARLARRLGVALAVFLLFPLSIVTVAFGEIREAIDAGSSRSLAERVPAGAEVACLECFPNGLPFYLGREVTIVSTDGRELTSNYALYKLRQGNPWPATLVRSADRDRWLEGRPGPVFVIAKKRARASLDSLAMTRGSRVEELRTGWWGALLPPVGR
jgi:4-amino-4-deoxy-L-arabinose transferase-like glycosyltransferase